eukprot:4618185-Pleurochrysis_carterae.AAC.1
MPSCTFTRSIKSTIRYAYSQQQFSDEARKERLYAEISAVLLPGSTSTVAAMCLPIPLAVSVGAVPTHKRAAKVPLKLAAVSSVWCEGACCGFPFHVFASLNQMT